MGLEDLAFSSRGSEQSGEGQLCPGTGVRKEEREATPRGVWSLAQAEVVLTLSSSYDALGKKKKKKKPARHQNLALLHS